MAEDPRAEEGLGEAGVSEEAPAEAGEGEVGIEPGTAGRKRRRFRMPHTLVLLFSMVVIAWGLTYALPAGEFDREEIEGHERVVAGSYHSLPDTPNLSPVAILSAVPAGLSEARDIIFFIFIVGGAFAVFRATGAADAGIGVLLDKLGSYPGWLLGAAMAAFAAGSASIGMAEEFIPFVPVLVVLCLGLGFDRVTAVGVVCVGYGVGYGAALINPFTVMIAQDIAGLTPTSGLWFRAVLLAIFFVVGFTHLYRYARRVGANPEASVMADVEVEGTAAEMPEEHPKLTRTHLVVLVLLVASLGLLIWGIKFWGWYLVEMGAFFLGISILLGLVGRLGADGTARSFCAGAAELTTTALLIGFARAIQVVLEQGKVVDTIIHGIAQPLEQLPPALSAVGMLVVQSLTNLFVPSGSGQAYVTMPIMAPLADLVEVSRQVAVLAYQFGDGFTNILVPTNAVLIGILSMAGVPYDRWVRFLMPLMVQIWVVAAIALAIAVGIGYS